MLYKTLLIILFISCSFFSGAQESVMYKSGIYKTFEEFQSNSPSISLDYNIIDVPINLWVNGSKEIQNQYFLKIKKTDSKEIGKIFGFSDGHDFYIGHSRYSLYQRAYYKIENISKNIKYFESIKSGGRSGKLLAVQEQIIYMIDGKTYYLTDRVLKVFLKDEKELYKRFLKESCKECIRKKYLIEYAN